MASDHKKPDEKLDQILSDWTDPPNVDDIIAQQLKPLKCISKYFPNWIVKTSPQFSVDLSKYNVQWAAGCIELNTDPAEIIIVKNTFMEERKKANNKYKLMSWVIVELTRKGYLVLISDIFDTCEQCNLVIVSKERMAQHSYSFSGKCQSCHKYDPTKPL